MVSRKAREKNRVSFYRVRSRLFGRWRQARLFIVRDGGGGGDHGGETRRVAERKGEDGVRKAKENQQNERGRRNPRIAEERQPMLHVWTVERVYDEEENEGGERRRRRKRKRREEGRRSRRIDSCGWP